MLYFNILGDWEKKRKYHQKRSVILRFSSMASSSPKPTVSQSRPRNRCHFTQIRLCFCTTALSFIPPPPTFLLEDVAGVLMVRFIKFGSYIFPHQTFPTLHSCPSHRLLFVYGSFWNAFCSYNCIWFYGSEYCWLSGLFKFRWVKVFSYFSGTFWSQTQILIYFPLTVLN